MKSILSNLQITINLSDSTKRIFIQADQDAAAIEEGQVQAAAAIEEEQHRQLCAEDRCSCNRSWTSRFQDEFKSRTTSNPHVTLQVVPFYYNTLRVPLSSVFHLTSQFSIIMIEELTRQF
jgi:hypothetical protein